MSPSRNLGYDTRYRRFESRFLQQRVTCEPNSPNGIRGLRRNPDAHFPAAGTAGAGIRGAGVEKTGTDDGKRCAWTSAADC
jgi:hypothetical protein